MIFVLSSASSAMVSRSGLWLKGSAPAASSRHAEPAGYPASTPRLPAGGGDSCGGGPLSVLSGTAGSRTVVRRPRHDRTLRRERSVGAGEKGIERHLHLGSPPLIPGFVARICVPVLVAGHLVLWLPKR